MLADLVDSKYLLVTNHNEHNSIVANFSDPDVGTNHTQPLYYTIEDHTSQLILN